MQLEIILRENKYRECFRRNKSKALDKVRGLGTAILEKLVLENRDHVVQMYVNIYSQTIIMPKQKVM